MNVSSQLPNGRAAYAWYLKPPIADFFDRRQWWTGEKPSAIGPVAALYELARRHPRIGDLRLRFSHKPWFGLELRARLTGAKEKRIAQLAFDDLGGEPRAVHCLCLIGLKSWPALDAVSQEYWEMSAGKLKGVDCRSDLEQCSCIQAEAEKDLFFARLARLNLQSRGTRFVVQAGPGRRDSDQMHVAPADHKGYQRTLTALAADLKRRPIQARIVEKLVASLAIQSFRAGDWLLSISPNLTRQRAEKLLSRQYSKQQKLHRISNRRARWHDWLAVIEGFEESETKYGGAKAQTFARYSRAIDGCDFR